MIDHVSFEDILAQYETYFDKKSYQVIKSPGRINILGEHLDYHEGYVMPAAIDKAVYFIFSKNGSKSNRYYASNLKDEFAVDIENQREIPGKNWQKYVVAIQYLLQDKGFEIEGLNCVFGGNVPVGAGMSSSAAITCGLISMWNTAFNLSLSRKECVQYAQEAEHRYVGVMCGIMDQFANTFGEEESILKLDCRDLSYELIPFNFPKYCFLLLNTGVKHTHAGGAYNRIRKQCEDSLPFFQKLNSSVTALRDVNLEMLISISKKLDPDTVEKIRYVILEMKRVEQASACLKNGDLNSLGELMYETHFGLQNEYRVSCEELDFLVKETMRMSDVVGARMMGGGFGGCTINLVPVAIAHEIGNELLAKYNKQFPHRSEQYVAKISQGLHLIS